MKPPRSADNELILGLVSVSDRASQGIYEDKGIPALEAWCRKAVKTPVKIHKRLIADERFDIEKTLRRRAANMYKLKNLLCKRKEK